METQIDKATFEQMKVRVKDFRPIDDAFFEVLVKSRDVCEEMMRTLMKDEDLKVEYVIPQNHIRNLYGRSICGDAVCTLGDGTMCNVEVQRSNKDNHLKRVRYNASCITVNTMEVGEKFEKVPTLYVFYISEFDFLKGGRTIYHAHKVIEETGDVIDDGLHEIFVNTKINDGTDIAELMQCFMQKEISNNKFPKLTQSVKYFKEDEKGVEYMCEIIDRERREGRAEGRVDTTIEYVNDGFLTPMQAAQKLGMVFDEFMSKYGSQIKVKPTV